MKYFMGVDAGTQGARVGVYDEVGNCIADASKGWQTNYPQAGWAEQEPKVWWDAILDCFGEISEKLSDDVKKSIETVVVDATSSTVLAVDKDWTPLRPAIMWMDIRATKEAEVINALGHEVLNYCGGSESPEFFVPKAGWVKYHQPEIYEKTDKFIEQLDWINYKLSGKKTSSLNTAASKANYVKSLGGYCKDFFARLGIEEYEEKLIQDPIPTGETIGEILPEIAKEYGFNPKMKLLEGGIDAHIGMFGTNAIRDGQLCMIMGTSFCHLGLSTKEPKINGVWGPYQDAVIEGTWCVEAGQASAAGLVQWFARNFHIAEENMFDTLACTVTSIPPGSEGLIVLDFFQGNRTPYKDPNAKGMVYGLTMKHTWKHIYRAILEGIAMGTYNIIDNFEKQNYPIEEIIGCGGVTKDHPFLQIIADVTGKPIIVNKDSQGGVLGCAVIGAAHTVYDGDYDKAGTAMVHPAKVIEPNYENHQRYLSIFDKYKALYLQTRGLEK